MKISNFSRVSKNANKIGSRIYFHNTLSSWKLTSYLYHVGTPFDVDIVETDVSMHSVCKIFDYCSRHKSSVSTQVQSAFILRLWWGTFLCWVCIPLGVGNLTGTTYERQTEFRASSGLSIFFQSPHLSPPLKICHAVKCPILSNGLCSLCFIVAHRRFLRS